MYFYRKPKINFGALLFLRVPIVIFVAFFSLAASKPENLSGELIDGLLAPAADWPLVGIVADTQLQTTNVLAKDTNVYRGQFADKIARVAMRPPALDWAARHMLVAHLEGLKERGAKAIFFLGDGANNGCADEFSNGFDVKDHTVGSYDQGLLALLAKFRDTEKVPVYFIIGNHDILGAGSTAATKDREALCGHKRKRSDGTITGENPPLTKFDIIRLTEAFNLQNRHFNNGWSYYSSYDANTTRNNCERTATKALISEGQHRRWGCYLAATVGFQSGDRSVEFLLMDTTDYVSVSPSRIGKIQIEGSRGAMSFGRDLEGNSTLSQTDWLIANTAPDHAMRIGLSHYNVGDLRKILGIPWSSKSQRFSSIFTTSDTPRLPKQDAAFVVTGHTHTRTLERIKTGFKIKSAKQTMWITELNVGSTTDYSNHSALLELRPGGIKDTPSLSYVRHALDMTSCKKIYQELAEKDFPNLVMKSSKGWSGIGIDQRNLRNYWNFSDADIKNIRLNLAWFVQEDRMKAVCIGLRAANLESRTKQIF